MPSPRRLQAPNAFDHLTSRRGGAARLADTDAYDDDAAAQKENHHPEGRAGSSALRPLSGDDSRMLIERVAPLLYTQGRKDEAKRVVEIARLLQGGGAKARARGGELAEYRDDAGEELASPGRTAAAAAVPERAPAPAPAPAPATRRRQSSIARRDMQREVLECPCCFDLMLPPVFQCRNGHAICSSCEPQLVPARCPACKEPMPRGGAPGEGGGRAGRIRALGLEQIACTLKLAITCPNAGCGEKIRYENATDHLRACDKRPFGEKIGLKYEYFAGTVGGAVECPVS